MCPAGYEPCDHEERRSGETALLYRDSLYVEKVDAKNKAFHEFLGWMVCAENQHGSLLQLIIYEGTTNPYGPIFTEFFDHL